MTRNTNARIAGVAFLAYIAAGISDMVIAGRATSGADIPARLSTLAQHGSSVPVMVLLGLAQCFCALILGVTLWAITRDEDADLSMMGMVCRLLEGALSALSVPQTLALLWLATASGPHAPDPAAAHALAAYLFRGDMAFTATFFAVGSALFAWLLLRGRMIPALLAWMGVVASVLLVICLPLQLAGYLSGPLTRWIWLPMIFFEVPVALWFLVKGVNPPARRAVAG